MLIAFQFQKHFQQIGHRPQSARQIGFAEVSFQFEPIAAALDFESTVDHEQLVLVADIGGGSTEFIVGQRFEPLLRESLQMGCVSYTLQFFPNGKVDKKRLREAQVAAAKEIELIAHDYQRMGWKEAVGSSGTARAIADVLELNDLNPNGESGITRAGLDKLCAMLIKAGSAEALDLPGIKGDRLPVFPGGVAIMSAIFEELGIERMSYADGALRLGVLYDLLGRFHHHDMRDSTVTQFRRRYQVEGDQVERVEATALSALAQISGGAPSETDVQFLSWACRLHEIGISVAHNAYHKHGAYLIEHSDLAGFSREDQQMLALLVRGHRIPYAPQQQDDAKSTFHVDIPLQYLLPSLALIALLIAWHLWQRHERRRRQSGSAKVASGDSSSTAIEPDGDLPPQPANTNNQSHSSRRKGPGRHVRPA